MKNAQVAAQQTKADPNQQHRGNKKSLKSNKN